MTKRFLTFSFLCICCSALLFPARIKPLVSLSAHYSNVETSITGFVDEAIAVSHFKQSADQDSLVCLGFQLTSVNLDVVGAFNLHQKLSILPDSEGFLWFQGQPSLAMETNSPRLGYAEFRYKGFLASLGRRPLQWGPALYDLGLSSEVPFYDGLWMQYRIDQAYGAWWYQLLATDFGSIHQSDVFPLSKQLYAHRIGFENHQVRAILGELSMNWGPNSLIGLVPFGVWPSILHDTANVLIEATGEILLGPSRFYGSMIVNDRTLFGIGESEKLALGGMLGFDLHVFSDASFQEQKTFALAENTFRTLEGGLSLGLECYYTSNYLYTGKVREAAYTALLKQFAYGGALYGDSLAYYIGFPYGPGSLLIQTLLDYQNESIHISALLGVLTKTNASAAILQASMDMDKLSLSGAAFHLLASFQAEYRVNEALQLMAHLKHDWNMHTNADQLEFGVGARFCWLGIP